MIRVLIVDDSPTARRLLSEIFAADPELVVVGEAVNGRDGVRKTERLRPDVITMDLHMPVMDGFEATEEIMKSCPTPIVIVSSSTMIQEVAASMKALRAGALTLILKPPAPTVAEFAAARHELVETVKAMSDVKVVRRTPRPALATPTPLPAAERGRALRRAVGIAASTGGPPALVNLLGRLPRDFPWPILMVQHIAAGFTDGLVAWLDTSLELQVKLAAQGEPLRPGTVYVAPEDLHLGVSAQNTITLSSSPPVERFRPAASYLFHALAKSFAERAIGIILTGMGTDGLPGLQAVSAAGGTVLAQNAESCVVFGMPGAVVEAGLANSVGTPEELAQQLVELVAEDAR